MSATHVLQTNGEVCPFPLIDAKEAMAQLPPGDELVIEFDCTQATESIPRWAAESGYPVTHFDRTGDAGWTITIRKA
ncbi:sulfurtransferase TusA family protein [Devriesea agamarum]|uniref:sulfurtransferase TusA family protein n=1 Tax=Devriesea agamarum TaxID=472569 RepID=UPI00071E3F8F|nr:sulfurtransferase TusA family protein [Devriesea agamarum]